jgi:hypothetical protein
MELLKRLITKQVRVQKAKESGDVMVARIAQPRYA